MGIILLFVKITILRMTETHFFLFDVDSGSCNAVEDEDQLNPDPHKDPVGEVPKKASQKGYEGR